MQQATAQLNHAHISPQKARLVADVVRGRSLSSALHELGHVIKKGAPILEKLLQSAAQNARNRGMDMEKLVITKLTVDEGPTLKRFMPRAHGRAAPIRRRTAHIHVTVEEA